MADTPLPPPVLPGVLPPPVPVGPPPGWYADPWLQATTRWWDGRGWTGHIGAAALAVPEPPAPTLPLRAGIVVIAVLAAALGVSRFAVAPLVRSDVPLLVVVAFSVLLAYGPVFVACLWVAKRWGTGGVARSLGFRVRGRDIGWGALTWLAIYFGNVVLAIVIKLTKVPLHSNVRGLDGGSRGRSLLLPLALVAIIAAPLVEELVFRGVVLRSFRSVMSDRKAIVAQGVLFGLAHVQAAFGAGNLGLVLLLSWAGIGFGFIANRMRRLGPSMFGHAIFNGVVFLILWLLPHVLERA